VQFHFTKRENWIDDIEADLHFKSEGILQSRYSDVGLRTVLEKYIAPEKKLKIL